MSYGAARISRPNFFTGDYVCWVVVGLGVGAQSFSHKYKKQGMIIMVKVGFKRQMAPVVMVGALFSALAAPVEAAVQKPISGPYIEPYFGCTVDRNFMMNFVYGALFRLETHFGITLKGDFAEKPSRIDTMLPGFLCAYKAGADCVSLTTQAYVDDMMRNPTEYVFEFSRQRLQEMAVSNHQDCVDYARVHQMAYDAMKMTP